MENKPTLTFWTEARIKPQVATRERATNVFDGSTHVEVSRLRDIPIWRTAVSPNKNESAPVSFALNDQSGLTWQTAATSPVTAGGYQVEWQQSNEGRWDFYFALPLNMACLGLGEQYSDVNLRGGQYTILTTDQTRHNEGAAFYKAIPFLILAEPDRKNCYGIFLDSPAPQFWDLDTSLNEEGCIKLLSRRGWSLYTFGPANLNEIVECYTLLTGRAPMPPIWSLGHQQSRWSYADEETAISIARAMRDKKIPCDTIVLDIDYMDEYRVFSHSKDRFPHFPSLAEELARQDLKLVTIVDPGIKVDDNYSIYKEAIDQNLVCTEFATKGVGQPFEDRVWPGPSVFPDFLKPETRKWWGRHLKFYTDNGIAGIWNDMNEPSFFDHREPLPAKCETLPSASEQRFVQQAPEGTVGHLEVRNLYGSLMCQATYEGLLELKPHERPFVLTRSGYSGIQKYSAVWLGDNMSWWDHLKKSVPMLLNIGLSGVAFCGVDIGGFGGDTTAELLTRWYEVGVFYPFFRNHCRMGDRPQEPWAFGPEVEDSISWLIEQRYKLLPYIYGLFYEHSLTGAPLMRPLFWHYPEDQTVGQIDNQFMFGADIMVAPVMERAHTWRYVYFPDGNWHQYGTGVTYRGRQTYRIEMPLGGLPAFIREGTILPVYESTAQSTNQYAVADVVFHVYGNTATSVFYEDDGKTNEYKEGNYNQWLLYYSQGQFHCDALHKGYNSRRRFYYRAGNELHPIAM